MPETQRARRGEEEDGGRENADEHIMIIIYQKASNLKTITV
jgi:hypothetical protein